MGLFPMMQQTPDKDKTIRNKPVVTRQMDKLQQCLLSKTRYRLDNSRWWAQQNYVLQRQYPSPRKRKQKTGCIN